jgi:hypothetical protein
MYQFKARVDFLHDYVQKNDGNIIMLEKKIASFRGGIYAVKLQRPSGKRKVTQHQLGDGVHFFIIVNNKDVPGRMFGFWRYSRGVFIGKKKFVVVHA